jgi:uncharacterized protein (DUF3084 family)
MIDEIGLDRLIKEYDDSLSEIDRSSIQLKTANAQLERLMDEFCKMVEIRDALVVKNAQLEASNKQLRQEVSWLRYRR